MTYFMPGPFTERAQAPYSLSIGPASQVGQRGLEVG